MIVVDANVLLDAYDTGATAHADATRFLEAQLNSDIPVGLPWLSIVAFVRIRTNSRLYERPFTVARARDVVDSWLARPNVEAISPGARHWSILRTLVVDAQAGGPLATDAHLAAMTIERGATLVTTNRDFARFPNLRLRGLTNE